METIQQAIEHLGQMISGSVIWIAASARSIVVIFIALRFPGSAEISAMIFVEESHLCRKRRASA